MIMRCFPFFLLSVTLLATFAGKVNGAILTVDVPEMGSNFTIVDMIITNDDVGSEYVSGITNTVKNAAQQIATLNSTTVGEIMSHWTYNISGEVDAGWSLSPQADGSIASGTLAPFGNDLWRQSTPSLDSQIQSIGINNADLELNATSGYQPFTLAEVSSAGWDASLYDAVIVRSDSALLLAANYTGAATPGEIPEAFVGTQDIDNSYSTSGLHYVLLLPGDFAEGTDFASEHPALAAGGDANGNGRSNFIDYATGQDPTAPGLLAPVELSGTRLTLRRRINGTDTQGTAEFSDNLSKWNPLEEGTHYTLVSNTLDGEMRTLVVDLLPGQPGKRFFRQSFDMAE